MTHRGHCCWQPRKTSQDAIGLQDNPQSLRMNVIVPENHLDTLVRIWKGLGEALPQFGCPQWFLGSEAQKLRWPGWQLVQVEA
jgi:hypothetical protein